MISIAPAEDGWNRNHEDIDDQMLIVAIKARIFERGKVVSNADVALKFYQ